MFVPPASPTMYLTALALAMIAQHHGEVCHLPKGVALVAPGKTHWLLGNPTFRVPDGTRAIVTRLNPEGTSDVAEVKVYDGTNRLGWVATSSLTTVKSTIAFSAPKPKPKPMVTAKKDEPATAATEDVKPYGVTAPARRPSNPAAYFAKQDDIEAGGYSSNPSGSSRSSGGYYKGSRKPPGHYAGGVGSSHKGGHYSNPATGNHYQKRK